MARRCWARAVSPCSDDMSGEHLISKALFPEGVTIRGFPWCATEAKTVGVNALTAKILCRHHNSALSALDAAAKKTWLAVRDSFDLLDGMGTAQRITGTKPPHLNRLYRLDGGLLERWCFKTTINMVASGNVRGFAEEWEPRKDLAEYVFGRGNLPDGCGLGLVVVLGESVVDRDHVSFNLIRRVGTASDPPDVEGFLMAFRGWRLAGSSTRPLRALHTPINFANPEKIIMRPAKMNFVNVGRVVLDWPQGYREEAARA